MRVYKMILPQVEMTHSAIVINLEARKDRLKKFLCNNIPGVEVFKAIKDADHPNYGCLQSHRAVLELSRSRGDEYMFIFEDDAVLHVSFEKIHEVVTDLQSLRGDWDIVLFSASQAMNSCDYVILPSHTELIKIRDTFCGTYAMAIACRAYDKIIACMDNLIATKNTRADVDIDVYSSVCADHIYLTLPFMSYVLSDQSDIRLYDTTDDLERIKLCQSRLLIETSNMTLYEY